MAVSQPCNMRRRGLSVHLMMPCSVRGTSECVRRHLGNKHAQSGVFFAESGDDYEVAVEQRLSEMRVLLTRE